MAWADFPDARQSVGVLCRSLERGRLGHAYLFSGDTPELLEGVAEELAMTVNCTAERPASDPRPAATACGTCSSCRRTRSRLHPDVHWLRAESKSRIIRVEQVRDLIQAVQLKPTEARFKVGVLADADRLNPQAANAFLKTLEEPPSRSLLLLLSTEPDRLLETILSRCLRLTFPGGARPNPAQHAWLREFATELTAPAKSLLGRYRLLDILLRRLTGLRESAEEAVDARSPAKDYPDADPTLREQWEDEAKAAAEAEYRRQRGLTLQWLQRWFRDVWLATEGQPAALLAVPELARESQVVASRISPVQALANLQLLEETQSLLHTNVQEALALEVALLRLQV